MLESTCMYFAKSDALISHNWQLCEIMCERLIGWKLFLCTFAFFSTTVVLYVTICVYVCVCTCVCIVYMISNESDCVTQQLINVITQILSTIISWSLHFCHTLVWLVKAKQWMKFQEFKTIAFKNCVTLITNNRTTWSSSAMSH